MAASRRTLDADLEHELKSRGADFICFVDISHLPKENRRKYPGAILFGKSLSSDFIQSISSKEETAKNHFHEVERETDEMADDLAQNLSERGYTAFSQSEENLIQTGSYNESTMSSLLPHKTIATLAGLGWIGKHNLLINSNYGSAISMCSVLTDAPVKTITNEPPSSECGDCKICLEVCQVRALKGKTWSAGVLRDEMLDVKRCTSCLLCLALCPWTLEYIKKALLHKE